MWPWERAFNDHLKRCPHLDASTQGGERKPDAFRSPGPTNKDAITIQYITDVSTPKVYPCQTAGPAESAGQLPRARTGMNEALTGRVDVTGGQVVDVQLNAGLVLHDTKF